MFSSVTNIVSFKKALSEGFYVLQKSHDSVKLLSLNPQPLVVHIVVVVWGDGLNAVLLTNYSLLTTGPLCAIPDIISDVSTTHQLSWKVRQFVCWSSGTVWAWHTHQWLIKPQVVFSLADGTYQSSGWCVILLPRGLRKSGPLFMVCLIVTLGRIGLWTWYYSAMITGFTAEAQCTLLEGHVSL